MSEFLKTSFKYQFLPIIEIFMDNEVSLGKKMIIHVSHFIEWRAKFGRIFILVVTALTSPGSAVWRMICNLLLGLAPEQLLCMTMIYIQVHWSLTEAELTDLFTYPMGFTYPTVYGI